ncbi:MAG: hypothetical protein R3C59_05005 [Planctomycetaceae bacterium]
MAGRKPRSLPKHPTARKSQLRTSLQPSQIPYQNTSFDAWLVDPESDHPPWSRQTLVVNAAFFQVFAGVLEENLVFSENLPYFGTQDASDRVCYPGFAVRGKTIYSGRGFCGSERGSQSFIGR